MVLSNSVAIAQHTPFFGQPNPFLSQLPPPSDLSTIAPTRVGLSEAPPHLPLPPLMRPFTRANRRHQ